MISNALTARADLLRGRIGTLFQTFPRYQLDFTWPSLGTVDLLARSFRNKPFLRTEELELFDRIVAYVGAYIHDAWSILFEEAQISLETIDEFEREVVISAVGGKVLGRTKKIELALSKTLYQVLLAKEYDLPVTQTFSRKLSLDSYRIQPYVLGVLTRTNGFLKGDARLTEFELSGREIQLINGMLSTSAAYYYERCFPTELSGSDATLYAQGLILPPIGFNEKQIGIRSSGQLYQTLLGSPLSNEERRELLLNLGLIADEQIATAALSCIAGSTLESDSENTTKISGRIRSLGNSIKPLFVCIQNIRAIRQEGWSFDPALTSKDRDAFGSLIKNLSLFGWMSEILVTKLSHAALFHIELFENLSESSGIAHLLAFNTPECPADMPLVQLFAVDQAIEAEFLDLAQKVLEHLKLALFSFDRETQSVYFALCAKAQLVVENYDEALQLSEQALKYYEKCELARSVICVALLEFEAANDREERLSAHVRASENNIDIRLNWSEFLFRKGEIDRAFFELKAIANIAANNPRFFNLLCRVLAEGTPK